MTGRVCADTDNCGQDEWVQREVRIANAQGLHARPVMRFVDLAGRFNATIVVCKGAQQVDGKSPMELMLLEATQGTALIVKARGKDASAAVDALAGLIASGFDESI
jgi:phosphotransferase system HPr (HPr) family protein